MEELSCFPYLVDNIKSVSTNNFPHRCHHINCGLPLLNLMSKKVVGKPKLSFDPDEGDEDNDGGDFQIKKSKEARKFKKMRQAPGIMDSVPVEVEPVKTVAASLGGAYSSENLAQLRKAQMFVAPVDASAEPIKSDSMEGVELSGEAAEEFVEMTERIAMKKNNNLGEYVSLDGGADDIEAIHAARLVNKSLLKGSGNEDRIYTSAVGKPEKRVGFDLDQSNDSDWEDEIIRRGVINKTALSARNAAVTEKVQQTNALSKSNYTTTSSGSVSGEITVADLMKNVQLAVDKLTFSEEGAKRKIEQLSVEIVRSLTEEAALRSKVEIGVKKLNTAQDMKFFFASVVGMLRDKATDLTELHKLVTSGVKERWELLQQRRLDEQEDVLYRLKEAGMMISIGTYAPSGILSPVVTSAAPVTAVSEVDEFGRVKADIAAIDPKHSVQALKKREDRRLKDRLLLSEQAEHLSAVDKELVIANRIADVAAATSTNPSISSSQYTSLTSLNSTLYQQLDACSAFYNTKGERVDFSQRAAMLVQAAQAAVADVEPSLCAVSSIVQRLLEFKSAYPVEFEAAFIADSAVELFQPLILLDLVPLAVSVVTAAQSSSGRPDQLVSFKSRPWYEAVVQFSAAVRKSTNQGDETDDVYDEAPRGLGLGFGSAKGANTGSMAAQIDNLFETGGQESSEAETVLTKIVDNTLLPWVKECLLAHLDTYNASQCQQCLALLMEIKDICSPRTTLSFVNAVVVEVERAFSAQISGICLPLLKLPRASRVGAGDAASTNSNGDDTGSSNGGSSEDFARAYTLHQVHRLQTHLDNLLSFRLQKLVRPEVAARLAWQVLVEQALAVMNKLLKSGQIKDKVSVLELCTAVLSIITCIRISPSRGTGNSLFDTQLLAWKIPPAQFRPLKTVVEKLLKTVHARDCIPMISDSSAVVSIEDHDREVTEGFNELSRLFSSF